MPRLQIAIVIALKIATSLLGEVQTFAGEWGTIKGRFLFDGEAPRPMRIAVDKDETVCGEKDLFSEDAVVDSKGGLANVVVYCVGDVKVHPDYAKTAADKVVLTMKGCRFQPHVLGVRIGQTLVIKNADPVAHNANVKTKRIRPGLTAAGPEWEEKIEEAENVPVSVSCNLHQWMKGLVLIRPNPYFAISDKEGRFEIRNLPVGDVEFRIYHERARFVKKAIVAGNKVEWDGGRASWNIKPDVAFDLGDIKLNADQFSK